MSLFKAASKCAGAIPAGEGASAIAAPPERNVIVDYAEARLLGEHGDLVEEAGPAARSPPSAGNLRELYLASRSRMARCGDSSGGPPNRHWRMT